MLIPDETLRQIPLSVLHNGKQFLIEEYALAVTPALTITTPKPNTFNHSKNISVLVGNLSKVSYKIKEEEYKELHLAKLELNALQNTYPQANILKGETFNQHNIKRYLSSQPYELIHFSSHAQFSEAGNAFIVLYDDKLHLDALEKLIKQTWKHKQNLELLTLSACETARGNREAALGLSGVALKAGAHSALASLWKVDEEAALTLTQGFYQAFQDSNAYISKAQALQKSQTKMIQQDISPRDWAAFLLIGNWL